MTLADRGAPNQAAALEAVHATVAYGDVFDMPLSRAQIDRFLIGARLDSVALDRAIDELVTAGRLSRKGDLVHLPGREAVLDVWHDRTDRARAMWPAAISWARRIGRLPFVRMVAVTGGLAVDSVADHDDIDYFIVVRPGRLWLTRLMIIVLGRVAARQDLELCPNFIVSDQALQMTDRTIYVARELAQMVVIIGPELGRKVRRDNDWMFDLLPNATVEGDTSREQPLVPNLVQRLAEQVLLAAPFAPVERWEMNRKIAKLTKVRSRRPEVGAPDESSFSPDICKGHMVGNAAGIDLAWRERLSAKA